MSSIPIELSNKFANMSFVCACLVVSMHLGYDHKMFGGWAYEMLHCGLTRAAVPFFFLASGFFLLGKLDAKDGGGGYVCELKKRVRSLLVPYLIWSMSWVTFISLRIWLSGSGLWLDPWQWIGIDLWSTPSLGPLWFLRNLMLLVFLSPALFFCIRRCRGWFVFLLFGLQLVFALLDVSNGFLRWTFRMEALSYFVLGAFLRGAPIQLPLVRPLSWCALCISIFLVIESRSEISTFFFVPLFMFWLWTWMPTVKLPHILTGAAFPVYLMHMFFISLFVSVAGVENENPCVALLQVILAIAGCIFTTSIMRRIMPKCAAIIFGGR